MRLIEASVQEIKQGPGIEAIYQHIERCGRTCYKSEDKITDTSARKFFQSMVTRGHTAMLEHGTVYFRFPSIIFLSEEYNNIIPNIMNSKYSKNEYDSRGNVYCTTNMRVIVEVIPDLEKVDYILDKYALEEPTEYHQVRYTAHWVISRGIANEFVRHRVFSFAQESTRYCNYSKDKFGNELTFIIPEWYMDSWNSFRGDVYRDSLATQERHYLELLSEGLKPQDARGVLPLDLKTELIMTGNLEQWFGFFDLRYHEVTGPAHPDAKAIATQWFNLLIGNGNLG